MQEKRTCITRHTFCMLVQMPFSSHTRTVGGVDVANREEKDRDWEKTTFSKVEGWKLYGHVVVEDMNSCEKAVDRKWI